MRDLNERPYSADDQRVVTFLNEKVGLGGGDDPIGFILASHDLLAAERKYFRSALLAVAAKQSITYHYGPNGELWSVENQLGGLDAWIGRPAKFDCSWPSRERFDAYAEARDASICAEVNLGLRREAAQIRPSAPAAAA